MGLQWLSKHKFRSRVCMGEELCHPVPQPQKGIVTPDPAEDDDSEHELETDPPGHGSPLDLGAEVMGIENTCTSHDGFESVSPNISCYYGAKL